jgi:Asparaginase, N-terminal
MSKPRIHILALGGTIATRPDASGAMQMGLGADDLVAAVPLLAKLAEIEAETVSRVGSHSLSFDQIHELATKIRSLKADGVVVTQGTDTLEETGFLLDLLLDLDIPVIVTAAMRNPALTSPDGPGNLLAAVRVACDPWVRAHAKALGVLAVMLDEVYAAADVLKVHPTRLNAFASPQTGPLAALVEDRIVPMSLPVRDCHRSGAFEDRQSRERRGAAGGALVDGPRRARSIDRGDAGRSRSAGLSRRGAGRDGRRPHARARGRYRRPPGRGDADSGFAARRRRSDAATDLRRPELGDRAAQGGPDLGRASQSAEGARAAGDLPQGQSVARHHYRGVRRLRLG